MTCKADNYFLRKNTGHDDIPIISMRTAKLVKINFQSLSADL